jgi:hypothetical protein
MILERGSGGRARFIDLGGALGLVSVVQTSGGCLRFLVALVPED